MLGASTTHWHPGGNNSEHGSVDRRVIVQDNTRWVKKRGKRRGKKDEGKKTREKGRGKKDEGKKAREKRRGKNDEGKEGKEGKRRGISTLTVTTPMLLAMSLPPLATDNTTAPTTPRRANVTVRSGDTTTLSSTPNTPSPKTPPPHTMYCRYRNVWMRDNGHPLAPHQSFLREK